MNSNKKILLVDDEKFNIFTLRSILEPQGCYSIDSTLSGFEAIVMVDKNKYDLVLLDVLMPNIDGYEVCAKIKEKHPDLPVVHITSLTESDFLKKGFESGAIDYIRKPVDQTELLSRVRNVIKNKEAEEKTKELYANLLSDLQIASRIQLHMLPPHFVVDNNINYSTGYIPSKKIGGDLFDIIKVSATKYFVYIGDVSGHGAQAALLMSAVKSTIHMMVEDKKDTVTPAKFATLLNQTLCKTLFQDNYMTLLAGFIDLKENTFRYFSAGHLPLIEYNIAKAKAKTIFAPGSIPLGWQYNFKYEKKDEGCIELKDNHIYI